MNNDINGTEESSVQMEKQNEDLKTLIDHRLMIDLHGMNLQEAVDWASSWAQRVINSEDMMCVGLIHGQGLHSDDYLDKYAQRELNPVLKPRIRTLMDKRAYNTECYSIYGENLFCEEDSTIVNEENNNPLCHESSIPITNENNGLPDTIKIVGKIDLSVFGTRRRNEQIISEHKKQFANSGITYFMNRAYYDFFKAAHIKWTEEMIFDFQRI